MFEVKGLDELAKRLNNLADRAASLHGSHEVSISELLTPAFLAKCSRFLSVDEMFAASAFKIETAEDFKAIPDQEWDAFIQKNTSFATWNDMRSAAAAEWTKKKLGL